MKQGNSLWSRQISEIMVDSDRFNGDNSRWGIHRRGSARPVSKRITSRGSVTRGSFVAQQQVLLNLQRRAIQRRVVTRQPFLPSIYSLAGRCLFELIVSLIVVIYIWIYISSILGRDCTPCRRLRRWLSSFFFLLPRLDWNIVHGNVP